MYRYMCLCVLVFALGRDIQAGEYYTEPQVYGMRPNPSNEWKLGPIGVTGVQAHINKGVRVTVKSVDKRSASSGKFTKGDVIIGVNGTKLKGKNPLVVLGQALTKAEATDGKLMFDIEPIQKDGPTTVLVEIPVLGAYGERFPLDCSKSKKVLEQAAGFYSSQDRLKKHDMWNALACLFLLGTGEEKYVPRVKQYFAQFLLDGKVYGIRDHSWYNGYNGIACAEYYLRTGDKSVLPILQHYCDDAKKRQKYGVGWNHWGYSVFASYESGGGMQHAAGTQILGTLLMGKLCGIDVDDRTLNGALSHWYRYVGHGAIPVADQRYWHIFRDAGRAGGTSALMHIASKATTDTTIYEKARDYMALDALTAWPARNYDWEVYWHSLAGPFVRDTKPELYHTTMKRFQWRYDLGRAADGSFAWAQNAGSDPQKSGICLALAYVGPLKTLQITGAPKSKFAKDFALPERLWGNETDLAFLDTDHHRDFYRYGEEDEIHVPFWQLPTRLRYNADGIKDLDLKMMLKNVHHSRCTVRMAAAKALVINGKFGEIEKLLQSSDPRLRRAALDGINDCGPWFTGSAVGRKAIKPEQFTPSMIRSINGILSNPKEAWFVIDGALLALGHAPVEVIETNMPAILKWGAQDDWWLRESAFVALTGFQNDEKLFVKHLPKLIDVMIGEYHYNPRVKMVNFLKGKLASLKPDSPARKIILAGLTRATLESDVRPNIALYERSGEGITNIVDAAFLAFENEIPADDIVTIARALAKHANNMESKHLISVIHAPIPLHTHPPKHHGHGPPPRKVKGLFDQLERVSPEQRKILEKLLFTEFRAALVLRLKKEKEGRKQRMEPLKDSIIEVTKLAKAAGVGSQAPTPNPATFAAPPKALAYPEVVMTATKGTDTFGPVEYLFEETSGNPDGSKSVWTTNPVFTDSGLKPGTSYSYTVKMRNAIFETSEASTPITVTTPDVTVKTVDIPNNAFETIYKPGQTTVTATISGWTQGVGEACPTRGKYTFSDKTTGTVADIPGWIGYDAEGWLKYGATGTRNRKNVNLQGLVSAGGRNGSYGYKANGGGWGNRSGGLIVSAASLGKVRKGATYILVAYARGVATPVVLKLLADGMEITPTTEVTPKADGGWQKFSRTYTSSDLAKYVSKDITIVCGLGRDAKGAQIAIDDISLRYYLPIQ